VQQQSKAKTPEKITISGILTVAELAKKLNKEPSDIIKKLMLLGTMATINQELEMDVIHLLGEEYGVEVEEKIIIPEDQFELLEEEEDPAALQDRPPVVTVMGHVDHGKTTLLDAIRETNVTAGEAGGITQHIGAYQIEYNDKKITFLDTPGHEAFTTMRARGAQVTDVAIIVVAADDGVMPQTREAINHAKAAEVPIIVAVNKMDKEGANPERVKQELTELELVPEEWGGETIFVNVSALNKEGMEELMEMVLLVSEVEELKANPDKPARGTVIEAELDKGKGSVATVLVQSGTLHVGDPIVIGNTYGRVRAMTSDVGKRLKKAVPSTPVEITGLHDVPQAGDQFKVFKDEKKARVIGETRAMKQKESERQSVSKVNLDELFQQIQQGEVKELNLIIKADVQGSAEALRSSLEKINVEDVNIKIIHSGVGAITESDVSLAAASNAIVIGFNVRPQGQAKLTAEREQVDIRLHRIIYNVIEEIESAMKGMLDPEYEEKVIGTVEVRQIFKVSKVGTIAGSYVLEGKITRDSSVRIIRDGVVIHEGKIDDLKRFKEDAKEVQQGYECGVTIENFNDIKEGDHIEAYVMEEVART
jgi:translation initiation factor IF-2